MNPCEVTVHTQEKKKGRKRGRGKRGMQTVPMGPFGLSLLLLKTEN